MASGSSLTGPAVGGEKRLALILAISAIGILQFGAALATTMFDEVGSAGSVLLRQGFATIVLLAIFRPSRALLTSGNMRVIVPFAASFAGMNLLYYAAIARIPLGIAVACEFIGPLAVAVVGSRRKRDLIWIALAVLGLFLITQPLQEDSIDLVGVALALAAGIFWGLYIVSGVRLGHRMEVGQGLALSMVIATLISLVPGIYEGGSNLVQTNVLAIGFAVAMLSTAIPYFLEMQAMRRLSQTTFGVLMSVEPAIASLIGFVVLSQALAAPELGGIACVIAASAGALAEPEAPPPIEA
ncbi:MAG: EamA family transporter [bacterium]